jgi:DNA-binding NarL/FixJ family response regulator
MCATARTMNSAPQQSITLGSSLIDARHFKAFDRVMINLKDLRPDPATPVRIVVVDDHGIVREGLMALLNEQVGWEVVGSAATGHAAIQAAERLRPDVIIMDLVLPDINGIDATEEILAENPDTQIIALSASHTPEHVCRALRAGVRGYVVKDAKGAELIEAVKAVTSGKQFLSERVALPEEGLLNGRLAKTPIERLSSREREVLHRIVEGSTSVAIAKELSLSRKTVDTYRARLMVKLGVSNRTALIRYAIENELLAL